MGETVKETTQKKSQSSSSKKKGNKVTGWFKGLAAEFKKIVWPDKKSLTRETVTVLVISVILAAVISVVDLVVRYGIEFLVR